MKVGVKFTGRSDCVLWQGNVATCGYGRCYVNGTRWYTHRLAYTRAFGPIPPGLMVLHRCDVRTCCNPGHLFLGTIQDNMRDKVSKGRQCRGETRPLAKLTTAAVREIRASGEPRKVLARRYGVSGTTITQVRQRKVWSHV